MAETQGSAHFLEGRDLSNGWKVLEKVPRSGGATGGMFSIGYVVEHADGRKGFLKALDFSEALKDLRELQRLLQEYNFECDLLAKCRERRLTRVATALTQGKTTVDGYEPAALADVHYVIFEFADGDIRSQMERAHVVWCLTVLHNVAVGLRQLHTLGIAHQDVKPSNVLTFREFGSKIGDLGSAVDRTMISPHDDEPVGGDPAYAPPEQLYRNLQGEWNRRRLATDMYLLGSLIMYMFTAVGTTAAVLSRMYAGLHYMFPDVTYENVMPHWRLAFEEVIEDFRIAVAAMSPENDYFARELSVMLRELCDPDPALRGTPQSRGLTGGQYSLERYVSRLDLMRLKAEIYIGRK